MFEVYLEDSFYFFQLHNSFPINRERERCLRASIFYAASAIEAFVNFIGETFHKGDSLSKYEVSFLLDKTIVFDHNKIKVKEKTEFHKVEDKIKLLVKRFDCDLDYNSKEWSDFSAFKRFRDSLIHPREMEKEIELKDYQLHSENGLKSIILIMNSISNGIFKKPLRKKILDLIPD